MKNLLNFISIIISLNCFGQRNLPPLDNNRYQFGISESRIEILENKDTVFVTKSSVKGNNTNMIEEVEKRYKGTPIYNNAWFSNSLIYIDGRPTKGSVAYNLLNREIQFSTGDIGKSIAIKPDSFIVSDQKFIQLQKTVKNAHNVYYQPISNGKNVSVYKGYNCAYRPKVYGQNTGYEINTDDFVGAFIKWPTYFILENAELIEIKPNSSVYKNFGQKKSEVEKYAKNNNFNPKKESDLVSILKYYTNL